MDEVQAGGRVKNSKEVGALGTRLFEILYPLSARLCSVESNLVAERGPG
jgi:hypothetical protein